MKKEFDLRRFWGVCLQPQRDGGFSQPGFHHFSQFPKMMKGEELGEKTFSQFSWRLQKLVFFFFKNGKEIWCVCDRF